MKASGGLPLRGKLTPVYILTVIVLVLLAGASLAGLLNAQQFYPGEALQRALIPNDGVNLAVMPLLLVLAMWLTSREKLLGLIIWPAGLLMVLYVYSYYLFGVTFGLLFPLYLLIMVLGGAALILLLVTIDGAGVRARLDGRLPARGAADVLIILGVFVLLRQAAMIGAALSEESVPGQLEQALWIADLLFEVPLMLVTGLLLWQRKPFGYVLGGGFLLQYTLLALALVPTLIYQAGRAGTAVDVAGIVIVAIMALICAMPFWLFVKAAR